MMKAPIRQRKVAWHLVSHPEHLHHPTAIAEKLQCGRNSVKLALNKLGKRAGETIDPERLCPECLAHTRYDGVCHRCGLELPQRQGFQGFFTHEVRNRIHEGFDGRPPIKLSFQTQHFLEGDAKDRLKRYCLSRLDQMFKDFMPDHYIVNAAAFICQAEMRAYLEGSDPGRFSREDRLAIMIRTVIRCGREMPQQGPMWSKMLDSLLAMPRVVLYG
jgi:hypothetical protein